MFSSGNLVVYPSQGLGTIEEIDHRDIGGIQCDFYIVRIRANKATLMVPVNNAATVGLRSLISQDQAISILNSLRKNVEKTVFIGQNWNRRFREYTERLKSPNLEIVANVLQELLLISRTKELSFGERRLLDHAMSLVSDELAEVLNMVSDDLRVSLLALYSPVQPVEDLQEA